MKSVVGTLHLAPVKGALHLALATFLRCEVSPYNGEMSPFETSPLGSGEL